jgi:hypothetical protein
MANGIAVNDNCLGVSPPLISTRQPYYPAPVGYYQLYNPASVVWETESLSTWSEWSDHDGPCCGCDCDCQPAVNDRNSGDRRRCSTQNRTSTVSDHSEGFVISLTFGVVTIGTVYSQPTELQSCSRASSFYECPQQLQHTAERTAISIHNSFWLRHT